MIHTRRLFLSLLLALSSLPLALAQGQYELALKEKERELQHVRGDKLKGFRLSPNTGLPYQVELTDTLTFGTHRVLAPEGRSLGAMYTGNASSPWQSWLFFDRERIQRDFIYLSGFQGQYFDPLTALYYDTRTPFTFAHYRKNFSDDMLEEVASATLSSNLGRAINLGATINYSGADGYYNSNRTKHLGYRFFGSFRSDRYDLWLSAGNDDQRQHENGGIQNLDYIQNPDRYNGGRVRITSKDVPVYLPDRLLFNRLTTGHIFLSHRYKLGSKRTIQIAPIEALKDGEEKTLRDSSFFVPVGSITHQVYYNKASRRLRATNESELFAPIFGSAVTNKRTETVTDTDASGNPITTTRELVLPNDTAALSTLHNTIALSLMEGFRPWVKAGLSAYLRTENRWFSNPDQASGDYHNVESQFSAFVGGELSSLSGKGLNFALRGELGILGPDLGALKLGGEFKTRFRLGSKLFGLSADASLSNSRPSYFAQHHHGTWGWWDKDFSFVRRLELGGRVDLASWGTWAELRTASLQNHIYWIRSGEALQHGSLIQMMSLRLGHRSKIGILGWNLEGAYQLSGAEDIVPLPQLVARGDLYLDFYIAKVLRVQAGFDISWHSAYYAPYYRADVMQFTNQSDSKIGGKAPLVNAYASFRHKNTRFYVRMFNIGESLFSSDRLSLHSYVYNPQHLQAGVVVDLRN